MRNLADYNLFGGLRVNMFLKEECSEDAPPFTVKPLKTGQS